MTRPVLRVIPTRRLAWAFAAAGILWLLPGRAGVYAGVAGIVAVMLLALGDWVMLPGRGGIAIEREVPGSVGIGDDVHGTYTVRSAWPRPLDVHVIDVRSISTRPLSRVISRIGSVIEMTLAL